MATDFFHSGDVVEAVLAALRAGLPANWFEATDDGDEATLRVIQHGDLADYVSMNHVLSETPALLVRSMGPRPHQTSTGSTTTIERARITHIRRHEDCRDADGGEERNYTRARERYAKLIHAAVFADPHRKLAIISGETRTEATLSSDDTAAEIWDARFVGWDLGHEGASQHSAEEVRRFRADGVAAWAIALDLDVYTLTTG